MVPALWAVIGCSIFIASRTTTRSPAATCWPSSTAILTMVPCMGAVSESPDAAVRGLGAAGCVAGPSCLAAPAPPPSEQAAGQDDLEALAADLDDDALALAGLLGGLGDGAGVGLDLVVELGLDPAGVHRERLVALGREGGVGRRRRGGTAARSACPSTVNSASARRDRSSAWCRSRPVTMSLASIESNAPPMTSPATTPESSRTPGPDGGSKTATTPGAGRKPRPASSPLIRNSKEWPTGAGSS